MNSNFKFWKIACEYGWVTAEQLRGAVKTEERPRGEITPEEFKLITGEDFIKVEKPVEVPIQIVEPTPQQLDTTTV